MHVSIVFCSLAMAPPMLRLILGRTTSVDFFTFEPTFLWYSYSEAPCSTEITVSTHGKKHTLLIQFSFCFHMFTTWSKITQVYNVLQENWKGKLKANMNTHRHTHKHQRHTHRLCRNSEPSSDSPHGYAWDICPASYVWWVLRPLPPPCTPALRAPEVPPAAATCGYPPSDTTACWWNSDIHLSCTLLTKNATKLTFFQQGIYFRRFIFIIIII